MPIPTIPGWYLGSDSNRHFTVSKTVPSSVGVPRCGASGESRTPTTNFEDSRRISVRTEANCLATKNFSWRAAEESNLAGMVLETTLRPARDPWNPRWELNPLICLRRPVPFPSGSGDSGVVGRSRTCGVSAWPGYSRRPSPLGDHHEYWRRGWDSNPRGKLPTTFSRRVRSARLRHLSWRPAAESNCAERFCRPLPCRLARGSETMHLSQNLFCPASRYFLDSGDGRGYTTTRGS